MSDADHVANDALAYASRWERLARAETHPLRVCILEVLMIDGGRTLSPKEISCELQEPITSIYYHIRALHEAGMLRLVHECQVRGVIEHFYCPSYHSAQDLFERL
jgi:DNA-binding transcriptional ArsR family regulator